MNNQIKLTRKLMLNKETLRELTNAELGDIAGGLPVTLAEGCVETIRRCPTAPPACPLTRRVPCPISVPLNNC
jgi:hypothetical protein